MTIRDLAIVNLIYKILPFYGIKFPRAAEHLEHYINNTGTPMILNPGDFKDNNYYKIAMEEELRELGQLAAGLAKGKKYAIISTESTVGYFSDGDLFYAIGGFHIWGEGTICTEDNKFKAELTIHFYDNYNWDKGKQVSIPLPTAALRWAARQIVGTAGPIRIVGNQLIVEDEALARLHRQGFAKEFEIKGQESISIEGTVGSTSLGTVNRGRTR